MTNRNYIRGRSHEYALKRKYEKDGWTVLRTAGSHGEFDLVAIRQTTDAHGVEWMPDGTPSEWSSHTNPEIVLIQAKSGRSAEKERKKLEPLKAKYEGAYSVRVELL